MTDQQQTYAGQLGLTDDTSDFNRVAFLFWQMLGNARTAMLVQVKAVQGNGIEPVGTVDVQPLVKQIDGVGKATDHGQVFGLPYFRVQGGAAAIIVDPKVGDIGLAIVSDRDISAVKSTKKAAPPGSKRRGSISDGLYVGGFLNAAPTRYMMLSDDGAIVVDGNGNKIEMKTSGMVLTDANGNKLEMKAGGTFVTGALFVTGAIVSGFAGPDQVGVQTHVHPANGSPPTPGT